MLAGVAILAMGLGAPREVALYCELNAPLMSRRRGVYAKVAVGFGIDIGILKTILAKIPVR